MMKTTYKNKLGTPMIRKCSNCIFYNKIDELDTTRGYCKTMPLHFAFTHEKSVYAIVKEFYICENHKFQNEDVLKQESDEVDLLEYLTDRNAKKKA